jgi:hypothetical protein
MEISQKFQWFSQKSRHNDLKFQRCRINFKIQCRYRYCTLVISPEPCKTAEAAKMASFSVSCPHCCRGSRWAWPPTVASSPQHGGLFISIELSLNTTFASPTNLVNTVGTGTYYTNSSISKQFNKIRYSTSTSTGYKNIQYVTGIGKHCWSLLVVDQTSY